MKVEAPSRANGASNVGAAVSTVAAGCDENNQNNADRALIGSLVDSYPFKDDGLVKKTISITHKGVPHHLVSYYNVDDVKSNSLVTPSNDPAFYGLYPRPDLIQNQNFRVAVDHEEHTLQVGDGWMQQAQSDFFRVKPTGHGGMMQEWSNQRSMSVPHIPQIFHPAPSQYPSFQQQGLPPFDPEPQSGYYHLSSSRNDQEYSLAPPNFPPRQGVPQIPNGLPEHLYNQHRRNTIHAANGAMNGADFAGLQAGAPSPL